MLIKNEALQSAVPNHSEDVGEGMLDRLLQYGILEDHYFFGRKALHWAAFYGDTMMAGVLLKCGIRIDATDHDGQTALHLACQGVVRKTSPVSHFTEQRAKILAHLENILARAELSNYAVVQLLLENGANAEAQDEKGQRPLHKSALSDSRIRQLLLSHGVDVNARDKFGRRA